MSDNKTDKLSGNDIQAIGNLMGGLLDKQAAVLASKEDLKQFATKTDLQEMETRSNDRMNEDFEAVMDGMDALAEKLTEKEKFDRLLEWAKEVGEKVGVKPNI